MTQSDAKAKVVAHRWFSEWPAPQRNVLGPGEWRYSTGDDFHPDYAEPLIPLTDHEAAMAELRASHGVLEEMAEEWRARCVSSEFKHATLLTGLEALAGEIIASAEQSMALDANDIWRFRDYGVALRTLTNSAKGGA